MLGRLPGVICGLCVLALSAGCGGDEGPVSDPELLAENGPFDGTLTIEPNPPHVGTHHVVITLDTDNQSLPLEGATVMLSPWMPAHGHGSTDVAATEESPGVYIAENVWLNMPGIWDLRVHVLAEEEGDLTATVEVP